MSKAKFAAQNAASQPLSSSWSFAQGFLLGQFTLAFILFCFIKFFIFGDPPPADSVAAQRAALRRQRTLAHHASQRRRSVSDRKPSAFAPRHISTGSNSTNVLTSDRILQKTYYNVDGHQPESVDWFNVLIAQTIAQFRADALEGDAVLDSLNTALNGPSKPDFLDDIRVTEISLGEEFPIFSNCRVIPVDENGAVVKDVRTRKGGPAAGLVESRLQARMDVDLSDVVTLGVETKLVLNYPKPFVAVLPVALSVSVVRFSGTLSMSFTPSAPPPSANANEDQSTGSDPNNPSSSPTTLTFTFLDDYRLDLSVHSLIGSRSRLQDVPKIATLVEQRLHAWFDERCVEPRFQQIVLPSLWPRKRNVRGGDAEDLDQNLDATVDSSSADRNLQSQLHADLGSLLSDQAKQQATGSAPRDETPLDHGFSDGASTERTAEVSESISPSTEAFDRTTQTSHSSSMRLQNALRQNGSLADGQGLHQRNSFRGQNQGSKGMSTDDDVLAQAGAEMRDAERREREKTARVKNGHRT